MAHIHVPVTYSLGANSPASKMAAEGDEAGAVSEQGQSKSDGEFAKVGTELFERKFERRPAIVHLDGGLFLKETKTVALLHHSTEVAGDVASGSINNSWTADSAASKPVELPKVDLALHLKEITAPTFSVNEPASQLESTSGLDTMASKSVSLGDSKASRILHEPAGHGYAGGFVSAMGVDTGFSEATSARSSSGRTGPMEDAFMHNEDMGDEDRNKAIAWAAAAQGVEHVGFLPECVLKTGFKIKKYKMWMPVEMCVDYQRKRMTLMCPDSVSDILLRKMVAHRIEVGDVRVETPISQKYKPGQFGNSSTGGHASGTSESGVPHFSKRRLNMVRTDGVGKYRLIAPTTDYRDRFLDILFMMTGPSIKGKAD